MTSSTLTAVPGTITAPGTAANAELGLSPLGLPPGAGATRAQHAFYRAATAKDYFAWLEHIRPAAGCSHPIRLAGEVGVIDASTGQLLSAKSTEDMPDGVIYKPCGNRRASVCPSCSRTYQRDAYQLIRAGLVGGKGIPTSVSTHPAVFATLCAPGFGVVHTRRTSKTGQQIACRPRRHEVVCPHGTDMRCHRIHADGEKILGQPLCLECYDYNHQVVWNSQAAELWRRTRIAIERAIRKTARARRISPKRIRLSYGKVAEMQRRGVVHYHAIVRLDGADPDDPDAILPPPDGLDVIDLAEAIASAAASTAFTTISHPAQPDGWPIEWGDEGKGRYADIRPIRLSGDGTITDGMVAGYLAKYATKSTEATGHVSKRLTDETIDLHADPDGSHVERLLDACWTLGRPRAWRGLRRWAHMLGFGGHFLTKSRCYSVTFRLLRDRRVIWRRTEGREVAEEHTQDTETTITVSLLTYVGAGWHNTGDALLAETAAAMARERQQIAREEITTVY